jgi:hypothetical protein
MALSLGVEVGIANAGSRVGENVGERGRIILKLPHSLQNTNTRSLRATIWVVLRELLLRPSPSDGNLTWARACIADGDGICQAADEPCVCPAPRLGRPVKEVSLRLVRAVFAHSANPNPAPLSQSYLIVGVRFRRHVAVLLGGAVGRPGKSIFSVRCA